MKIFHRVKHNDGRREIYFLNIKIYSYKKDISEQIKEDLVKKARELGVKIGEGVKLISMPGWGSEPYLIEIEDNVKISFGVTFLTHDGAWWACKPFLKEGEPVETKVGRIKIKEGCFIGCKTTILPGCTIGKYSVTGACSVVTKDIPDGEVWAGNPAKFICKTSDYTNKLYKIRDTKEQKEMHAIINKIRNNK